MKLLDALMHGVKKSQAEEIVVLSQVRAQARRVWGLPRGALSSESKGLGSQGLKVLMPVHRSLQDFRLSIYGVVTGGGG